jgi:hypothetical protein
MSASMVSPSARRPCYLGVRTEVRERAPPVFGAPA